MIVLYDSEEQFKEIPLAYRQLIHCHMVYVKQRFGNGYRVVKDRSDRSSGKPNELITEDEAFERMRVYA